MGLLFWATFYFIFKSKVSNRKHLNGSSGGSKQQVNNNKNNNNNNNNNNNDAKMSFSVSTAAGNSATFYMDTQRKNGKIDNKIECRKYC